MKIAVVGLGLIGGSFCKSIKKNTRHICYGCDIDQKVMELALAQGVIDAAVSPQELTLADLTIICLYPEQTIRFLQDNLQHFQAGSIVIDACGVKKVIVDAATPLFAATDVTFIGAHPMAGREFSGFAYATDNLFEQASFIMTPTADASQDSINIVRMLANELGFGRVVITTPEHHDTMIAATSQLAHIVSNAYIKSPTLRSQAGFSAGSYQDLTRVARLNEDMWTSLFLMNRQPLLFELDFLIERLFEYRNAIAEADGQTLHELLFQGRVLKEQQG